MQQDSLLKHFIEVIKQYVPQRGALANLLADTLCIDKEAVYRRLRGEVAFSFSEIAKVASHLGISLDSIVEGLSPVSKPFNIRLIGFINPSENDYKMLEDFTSALKSIENESDSESGSITSIIPTSLCVSYQYIYKFYLFKWSFQFSDQPKSYAEIMASERLKQINQHFIESVHTSPTAVYIFDERFILYFVNDVRYFYMIKQLSKEDVAYIKKDLFTLLSELEKYAIRGMFDEGGHVQIYLSNIHFEATFNYIDAKNFKLTMMRSFTLSEGYSFDLQIFENMKKWTTFLKRSSTMISETNEIQRIAFFEKQRQIVDSLNG
jgi:DNA-binding phage protein